LRQAPSRVTLAAAIGCGAEAGMDWDELKPKPAKNISLGEPLDSLSVGELEARIAALQAEIERVKDNLVSKKAHEAAAAAAFKR
jgi:uncharacterized small protein (DUF1192 family)